MYWFLLILIVGLVAAPAARILLWEKSRRMLLLALRSLWLHKLRSFLSVLGIIIGTAAVIALMAFGEGSMQDALDEIERMGATNVIVRSVKPPDDASSQRRNFVATFGLTRTDYERIATMMQSGIITRMVPMRVFPQELRYLAEMYNGRVVGTTPEYVEVNQLEMARGRFFDAKDYKYCNNVAVLGHAVARHFFPFDDPIGKTIRIGEQLFKVIGVCRERLPVGSAGGSVAAEDFNKDFYIPLTTCNARFGEVIYIRQSGSRRGEQVEISQITLTVADMDRVRPTAEVIRQLLAEKHERQDWELAIPLDRLRQAQNAKDRYQMLLVLIASISLVVGGIGIMNIMLATVSERVREIGIRRALGAKRRDITSQFLLEAVAQTSLGGLVGVAVGLLVVFALPPLVWYFGGRNLPAKLHVPSVFLSLGVSVGVGILFGWYPARRAARLDPIEALRHE
ncbi:MAG: ABC transporter substrate-binding protein [Gemmatales bacterium]|nr:MAG: ABC transporter substrate-binding protein [Gemmatales bacterium]